MGEPNDEQRAYWNEQAGPVWVARQERLDDQIRPHGRVSLEWLGLTPGERVLDVGCGCGDSTLEIARRVGPGGEAVGVDLSEPMLARARERAEAEGLVLRFVRADAQCDALGEGFDAVHSRFGVMFFEDPIAAFANLRGTLRPGGRLAFVCWQALTENPWVGVPISAIAPLLEMPPPAAPDAPGPFAFADAERVRTILTEAGFGSVSLRGERVPMQPGGGAVEKAAELFLEVGPVARILKERAADEALLARVREALEARLAEEARDGHLELGSAVWLVTARNLPD